MVNKNFTRKDLSNKIYKNIGFSKNLSLKIVDNFFESIISAIIKSNKIKISSFGTFSILNKKERIGRNPNTGVEAKIFSRKVVLKSLEFIWNKISQILSVQLQILKKLGPITDWGGEIGISPPPVSHVGGAGL